MTSIFNLHHVLIVLLLTMVAVEVSADIKRFDAADSEGVEAARDERAVYLSIDPDIQGPISIPRLAAPLRSMRWHRYDDVGDITLTPEQDTWVIRWKNRPKDSNAIILNFGASPMLPSEVMPGIAAADGSFYLPAHLARTHGENIRYEPQPHKNTVGYWTGKQDFASWSFKLDKPGRFNVAILQGCGKGQGGSASITFMRPIVSKQQDASLDFDVVETGHFQNFQWRTLGEVTLDHAGEFQLTVLPKELKASALIDIRAIHLIRLPEK